MAGAFSTQLSALSVSSDAILQTARRLTSSGERATLGSYRNASPRRIDVPPTTSTTYLVQTPQGVPLVCTLAQMATDVASGYTRPEWPARRLDTPAWTTVAEVLGDRAETS